MTTPRTAEDLESKLVRDDLETENLELKLAKEALELKLTSLNLTLTEKLNNLVKEDKDMSAALAKLGPPPAEEENLEFSPVFIQDFNDQEEYLSSLYPDFSFGVQLLENEIYALYPFPYEVDAQEFYELAVKKMEQVNNLQCYTLFVDEKEKYYICVNLKQLILPSPQKEIVPLTINCLPEDNVIRSEVTRSMNKFRRFSQGDINRFFNGSLLATQSELVSGRAVPSTPEFSEEKTAFSP